MSSEVQLSIVVPTRNRAHTAVPLVRKLLAIADAEPTLEVLVQDCGTTGVLPERLGALLEHRQLRYAHTGRLVSMTENWNAAAARVRGAYVAYLGDDDGASVDVCAATRWMQAQGMDALAPRHGAARYYWPDYPHGDVGGTYRGPMFSGAVDIIDPRPLVARASHGFGQNQENLPKVYHGIVRRDRFESLVLPGGGHFRGANPDLYSQFRLGLVCTKMAVVDYPVLIPGASASSNHAETSGARNPNAHFSEFTDLTWPSILPDAQTRSVVGSLGEGMVNAFEDANEPRLLANIDLGGMYAHALRHDPSSLRLNARKYFRANKEIERSAARACLSLALGFGQILRGGLERRLRARQAGEDVAFADIPDIGALVDELERTRVERCLRLPWTALP